MRVGNNYSGPRWAFAKRETLSPSMRRFLADVADHRVVWDPHVGQVLGTAESTSTLGAVERRKLIDYAEIEDDPRRRCVVVLTDRGKRVCEGSGKPAVR